MKTRDLLLFGVMGLAGYYLISQQSAATAQRDAALRAASTQGALASGASGGSLVADAASIAASIFKIASTAFSSNTQTI